MIQDDNLIEEINALPPEDKAEIIDFIHRLKLKQRQPDNGTAEQSSLANPADPTDPIFEFGKNPVSGDVTDASENHDNSPAMPTQSRGAYGSLRGTFQMAEDFNQPLQLVPDVAEPASKHSLCELQGLGKELWQTIQVDTFLEEERNAWA